MHRKPPRREVYGPRVSVVVALIAIVVAVLFCSASGGTASAGKGPVAPESVQLLSAPVAAAAAPPGCNLSPNWRVTASAKWNGTTFSYGVLNSPGELRHGGMADGRWSEYFLFRGATRTWSGTYSDRDPEKAPRWVYRTLAEGGPDFIRNVNEITQVPVAPSGAFCLITIKRPS